MLGDERMTRDVEVFNLPGADGTVGLARLVYESGNPRLLMLMGLGVVAGQHSHDSRATLRETTPIARLMQEPGIVVVTKDSEYRTMDDLVAAWRRDPAALKLGGGSAKGGPDHVAAMLVAKAAGISPVTANGSYVGYQGGGSLLAAILGKRSTSVSPESVNTRATSSPANCGSSVLRASGRSPTWTRPP